LGRLCWAEQVQVSLGFDSFFFSCSCSIFFSLIESFISIIPKITAIKPPKSSAPTTQNFNPVTTIGSHLRSRIIPTTTATIPPIMLNAFPIFCIRHRSEAYKTLAKREVGAILNRRHIHKYVENQNRETSLAARLLKPQ